MLGDVATDRTMTTPSSRPPSPGRPLPPGRSPVTPAPSRPGPPAPSRPGSPARRLPLPAPRAVSPPPGTTRPRLPPPVWVVVLLALALNVVSVKASWLYLGIASLATRHHHQDTCNIVVPDLVEKQIEVCQNNPDAILCVGEGVRRGIYECQTQFKTERWNCTTTRSRSVFGNVLRKGTKEAAFIHAVTAAGVMHAVTQSCSAGNLTDCSCDMTREGLTNPAGWKWGGCSDNIDYGIWFSRTFVDAPEEQLFNRTGDGRALMNLHNNRAGRMSIANQMVTKCRCHGVSGSCAVKSCWRTMPSFKQIGDYLKTRYEHSIQVSPRSRSNKLRRRERKKRKVPISGDELVHIHGSPNYCRTSPKNDIIGTRGRQCVKDPSRPGSCDQLCCGRGYNTEVVRYVERCHCKFVWCCYVKCKQCETMIDKHTCK